MKRFAWTAVFLASLTGIARAQEGLKPTDILDYGKIAGVLRFDYEYVGASLNSSLLAMDVDLDVSDIAASLDLAGGLGRGIGVEMILPFTFLESTSGSGSIGGTPIDSDVEASGLGDIQLIGNYRIIRESKAAPHLMAGLILVLPTGNDTIPTEDRDGGVGEGVVKLGMQTGFSKDYGIAEPYGLIRYVLPLGDNTAGDTDIDLPNVFSLTLGSQFRVAKNVTIDARLVVSIFGSEITEEAGVRQTAQGFMSVELGAQAYYQLGNGLTVLGGPRIFLPQGHTIGKESGVDLEDSFGFGFTIGVQYLFEAVKPPPARSPAGGRGGP